MKKLTEGNIYKTFILFAIPLVLSGILSKGYTIVDTMIAGKFLGEHGLAAIGATGEFSTFLISVFWGYGAGFTIYAAKLFGAENYKKMKTVVYTNLVFIAICAAIVSILVIVFRGAILDALEVDPSIRADASLYLAIYVSGFIALTLNSGFIFVMNSMGISTYPFIMSLVSTFLNIGGNIFTIAVLDMGVEGVAISSVAAAAVTSVLFFLKTRRCFKVLCPEKTKLSFKSGTLAHSFSYGAPTMLQQMIMYTSGLMISPMVNSIGSTATASYSVVTRIYDINAGIYQNSSKTLSNYTAQCIGAKKYDSLKRGVFVGLVQGITLLTPALLACIFFSDAVCGAFFPGTGSEEGLSLCTSFIRYYMPFLFINVVNNLFHSFFRGTASMKLLITSTFVGAASRLILSFILVKRYMMHGIYTAWVISWVVEAVYCIFVYYSGSWKKALK